MRNESSLQRVRLNEVAEVNPESLPQNTSGDYTFTYVDLSAVSRGVIDWSATKRVAFRFAPSRARRKVLRGDCLFGTVRPSQQSHGSVDRDLDDLIVSTGFAVLRPHKGCIDSRFLHHWILSDIALRQAENAAVGSNYPAVNEADVGSFILDLPSLPEQRRIAEILDALDNQIKAGEKLVEKQLQIKQGLLEDLSREAYSDNNLVTLAELSELITSGSRSWAQYYSETGALFIRVGNLTREHINLLLEEVVYVEPPRGTEGARTALRPGDVLISITADLGIIGVVPEGLGEAYVNQHISLVRPRPHVNPRWVGHMLASEQGQRQFKIANDAGAKAGLNLSAIGRIHVPLPPRATQDKIAALLDEQDYALRQQRVELEKLRLLKQGLMNDLLTGRVRVPVGAADGE